MFGQDSGIRFSHLTEEQGFPDHKVLAIFKDSKGHAWFGTDHDLIRWDGQHFFTYSPIKNDTTSLSNNTIKDVREDNDGNIWLATVGGGLNKFDRETEQFKRYIHDPNNPKSIPANSCISLYIDPQGIIWIGTFHQGFMSFDPKTEKFTQHNLTDKKISWDEAFMQNSVHDFVQDVSDPNILWVAGTNSLYAWNKKAQQITRYPSTLAGTENTSVEGLVMDKAGELWLATYGRGIIRFDTNAKTWNYHPGRNNTNPRIELIITAIQRKSPSELWYSSVNKGTGIFNTVTGQYQPLEPDIRNKYSILPYSSNLVYVDKDARVWFAYDGKGISYSKAGKSLFDFTEIGIGSCTRTNYNNEIVDFAYDPQQKRVFLAGSTCDGIVVVDDKREIVENIRIQGFESEFQDYKSLLFDSNKSLWVGTSPQESANGLKMPTLYKQNPLSRKLEPFSHPEIEKYNIQEATIKAIFEDSKGRIWIGADPAGILLIEGSKIQIIQPKIEDENQSKTYSTTQFLESPDGEIWVAIRGMGLYHYAENNFKKFNYKGFGFKGLNSFAIDRNGNLWIGHGSGLTKIDQFKTTEEAIVSFTKEQGFPESPVDKVLMDGDGNIWATTFKGIIRYVPENNYFIRLDEFDGLRHRLFFRKGFKYIDSGDLLIGNDACFYTLKSNALSQEQSEVKLVFTEMEFPDRPLNLERNINYLDKIVLDYNQNFFTIKYSLLVFDGTEDNNYQYILEGYDKGWNQVGNKAFADYTKVREGNYTFRVKGTDRAQRSAEARIQISINPPWYRSLLAYILYGISILGLAYFFYAYQRRRWQLQTKLQLKEQEAIKLKELDLAKTRLYANITHEFRTPLTIISGMASQVREEPQKWLERGTEMIERNTKGLLNLVNQMLDLSKLESGKLKLHLVQGNIIPYLRYIMESFQSYADTKALQLHFISDEEEVIMDYDPDKLLQIISNLLSNAIKFTPDGGQIYLQVAMQQYLSKPHLQIKVKDTGIGISEDQLEKLFERFYQVDASTTRVGEGTGIGLTLTRELVQLLDGAINVASKPQNGSTFTVLLPIRNNAPFTDLDQKKVDILTTNYSAALRPIESTLITEDGTSNLPPLLLVEDNPDVIQYLIACLEGHYQILEARDGEEGIAMAIKHVPDIIISDVMMPKKDGFEVCDTLKQDERTSHIPIILLTAKADVASRLEGLKRGADAYLAKPFDKAELFIRLEQLIELRQKLQKRYTGPEWNLNQESPETKTEDAFLIKVRQVIESHLDDSEFTIHQLCKAINLSRTQVHQKIKHLTGRSTSLYVRYVRLQKAYQLLKNRELNISEVAYEVGFKDPNYFTRVFTEEFGASPTRTR